MWTDSRKLPKKIDKMKKNVAVVHGRRRPINRNVSMLFADDDMGAAEKTVLRAYLDTTRNIAGCQAIRQRIGHILFGFRCVHGEVIFVTVSPNRRNSSMILTLSRARSGDASLRREDDTTKARREHAGSTSPKVFTQWDLTQDPDGEKACKDIKLPELLIRQRWNSQDPLASVHHYLVIMYVALPAAFGVRMCMSCPGCNKDTRPHQRTGQMRIPCEACADYMGSNGKCLGGFAGFATGLAFATEFQGDGTPYAHGLVSLANKYQRSTLEAVGDML